MKKNIKAYTKKEWGNRMKLASSMNSTSNKAGVDSGPRIINVSTQCRYCGGFIYWIHRQNEAWVPIDYNIDFMGDYYLRDEHTIHHCKEKS